MKRTTGAMVLLAALGGCVSQEPGSGGQYMSRAFDHGSVGCMSGSTAMAPSVPGFQGPNGAPIAVAAPYSVNAPGGADLARSMVRQSVPLELVQQTGFVPDGKSGVIQAQGFGQYGGSPPPQGFGQRGGTPSNPGFGQVGGAPPGDSGFGQYGGNPSGSPMPGGPGMSAPGYGLYGGAPPSLMPPGLQGPGGPGMAGPGMMMPGSPGMPGAPGMSCPPGAVAAVGALTGSSSPYPAQRTEVRFTGPNGMRIAWFAPTADGKAGFGKQYLEAPGRYNFLQAAVYRLKLSDVPNRPGVELYPTLEVVPANAKTSTFLAHSAVPVTFTEEDFNQVASGNYLVKVVYLPDPQFQDLAATGTDEVISSRLEPGVDPIAEAHRRGSILLVVRLGNIDLEAPNTPAMDAPSALAPRPQMVPTPQGPGGPNRMMLPPAMPPVPTVPPAPGTFPPPTKIGSGLLLPPAIPAPSGPAVSLPAPLSAPQAKAPAVKTAPSAPAPSAPPAPPPGPSLTLPDPIGPQK